MSQWRSKIGCVYLGVKVRPSELKMFLYVFACHSLSPLQVSFFRTGICVGKIRKMLGVLMDGAVKLSSKQIRRAWCPRTRDPLPLHSPFLERPLQINMRRLKGSHQIHQRPRLWGHVVRCAHHGVGPTFQFSQLFRHLWHEKHEGHGVSHHFTRVFIYLNLLGVCDVYTTCIIL